MSDNSLIALRENYNAFADNSQKIMGMCKECANFSKRGTCVIWHYSLHSHSLCAYIVKLWDYTLQILFITHASTLREDYDSHEWGNSQIGNDVQLVWSTFTEPSLYALQRCEWDYYKTTSTSDPAAHCCQLSQILFFRKVPT